jgi:hypothetical protein
MNYLQFEFLYWVVFGRIWQHAKYCYRVYESFAYNSDNFQKPLKIEKCNLRFFVLIKLRSWSAQTLQSSPSSDSECQVAKMF